MCIYKTTSMSSSKN